LLGTKRDATLLNEKQFIHITNKKDGSLTAVKGPGLIFLKAYERVTDKGVQTAIPLKPDEYVKLINKRSGEIRVERGETLVFTKLISILPSLGVS
jgi:hypothetical protein